MIGFKYKINKKAKYSITFMLVGMIIIRFWGLFFLAPQIIKLIYALLIYFSLIVFPYQIIKSNELIKYTKPIMYSLLCVSILQIIRSVFNTEDAMYAFGNKWITLFGNEYTSFIFIPPLFIFLSTIKEVPKYLIKSTFFYIISCFFMLLVGQNSFAYVSIFLLIFWPFIKTRYKVLTIITYIMTIKFAFDGARMFLITSFFAFSAYFIVYKMKERFLKLFISITLISIPIIFIPTLYLDDYKDNNKSYFQLLQKSFSEDNEKKENFGSDTRTFLYVEMAQDLSNTNSWILGKGALSYYYSNFFDYDSQNKFGRLTSEVPFLNYLLRGGIIYISLYFGLILYAIWCAINYGKNKFVKSIAIILTGWIFNSFIGDITGCTFYHIGIFILTGCCLNKEWLNYSDYDIYRKLAIYRSFRYQKNLKYTA